MKIYIKNCEEFHVKLLTLGFSKALLAEQLGVSRAYIYSIANGKNIGAKLANKICKLLKCDFDDIFFIKKLTKVSNDISTKEQKGA